jgi:uncharacterized membrane protein YfcA
VIGLVGGLLSGAFGVGGGIIMVPLLVSFGGFDQRRASAISLLAILPASLVGSITYLAHGEVDVPAALLLSVGAIGGSFLGSYLLTRLHLTVLRWLFIALVVATAVRMVFANPDHADAAALSPLVALGYLAIGLAMGIASGLFGIGGGVIAVPALVAIMGATDVLAKGTSLLAMVPTSLSGTIANARRGLVDVRAGLTVGLAAAAASVPGAYIALAMAPRVSTLLFAVLLAAIAVQLTVKAIRAPK